MPEAHALDGQRALVLLPCLMGPYQGSSLAFVVSRSSGVARQLVLSTPYLGRPTDDRRMSDFTNADFDLKTDMLSMSAKGRGLADCGFSASWIWNGTEFRLSGLAFQDVCGGVNAGEWPTLFRSIQ